MDLSDKQDSIYLPPIKVTYSPPTKRSSVNLNKRFTMDPDKLESCLHLSGSRARTKTLQMDPAMRYFITNNKLQSRNSVNVTLSNRTESIVVPISPAMRRLSTNHNLSSNLSPFRHGSLSRNDLNAFNLLKRTESNNNGVSTSLIGFKNLFKNVYKKNEEVDKVIKKLKNENLGASGKDIIDYHVTIVIFL
jgi:hypothetical protein